MDTDTAVSTRSNPGCAALPRRKATGLGRKLPVMSLAETAHESPGSSVSDSFTGNRDHSTPLLALGRIYRCGRHFPVMGVGGQEKEKSTRHSLNTWSTGRTVF